MEVLTKKDLTKIQGGISINLGIIIVGIVTFIIGVIDGYKRPYVCRVK